MANRGYKPQKGSTMDHLLQQLFDRCAAVAQAEAQVREARFVQQTLIRDNAAKLLDLGVLKVSVNVAVLRRIMDHDRVPSSGSSRVF